MSSARDCHFSAEAARIACANQRCAYSSSLIDSTSRLSVRREGALELLLVAEKYQTGFDQPLLHSRIFDGPARFARFVTAVTASRPTVGHRYGARAPVGAHMKGS